jgi:hypothetical protein
LGELMRLISSVFVRLEMHAERGSSSVEPDRPDFVNLISCVSGNLANQVKIDKQ